MKRHSWKPLNNKFHPKADKCIKCGIERYWLGGDMQGYEYLDLRTSLGVRRTCFHRPECEPDIDPISLNRDGSFNLSH